MDLDLDIDVDDENAIAAAVGASATPTDVMDATRDGQVGWDDGTDCYARAVPEPSTGLLLLSGAMGLAGLASRRR